MDEIGQDLTMRIPMFVVGVVLTVFGVIFALQGFNVLGGSAMSGTKMWAILGPIIAIVGLVIISQASRFTKRNPRP